MDQKTHLINALRAKGQRVTKQRLLILEVLTESKEHLDAWQVSEQVKARDAGIGIATVYRTLALLKDIGLVQEHRLGEEHGHFESMPDAPHFHFKCKKCDYVIEFEAPSVLKVVNTMINEEGIQVVDTHLLISGYCKNCRED